MDYARAPLARWERAAYWAILAVIVGFGGLVEFRAAFAERRMSDLTVFMRAGWAVRSGQDIYAVSDEGNGWYYVYPPFFAILMAPLAEAPPGADHAWMVPYPVTVALWYFLNVGLLFWAIHRLANAVQKTSADPEVRDQPAYCRRWWALRGVPFFICMIPLGSTLSHGQTNIVILAMLCGMLAAVLEKKSFRAGLWMAGPICMKVFPAFLLIYPLWRRDFRCLAGCAAGLFIGLIALPIGVLGPERTVREYREFADMILLPGIGEGDNHARAETLTSITKTDTQSFMAILHNAQYADMHINDRPTDPSLAVRLAHWGLGAVLTALVCVAAGWKKSGQPAGELLFLGLLIMLMMFLSPVCHLHYFGWLIPVIMALHLMHLENRRTLALGVGWWIFIIANNLVHAAAHMDNPGLRLIFRELGTATWVGMALGAAGMIRLCQMTHERPGEEPMLSSWAPLRALISSSAPPPAPRPAPESPEQPHSASSGWRRHIPAARP